MECVQNAFSGSIQYHFINGEQWKGIIGGVIPYSSSTSLCIKQHLS